VATPDVSFRELQTFGLLRQGHTAAVLAAEEDELEDVGLCRAEQLAVE
jgi:hypothetical protein